MASKRLIDSVKDRRKRVGLIKLLKNDNGLVSSMEMTIGIMFSFILIIFAILLITYLVMGNMIDNAILESARAGSQYLFSSQTQAGMSETVAEQTFARAIPASSQVSCTPLLVTTPTVSNRIFAVSSQCTINMGSFLGVPIRTGWTAKSNVPVGPESVVS